MSITDELRSWAAGAKPAVINGCDIYVGPMTSGCMGALTAIADRIDAEHERQLGVLYRDMSDAEWVRLPKDADGEVIRIGDKLIDEDDKPQKPAIVKCILYNDEGCVVSDIDPRGCWYDPSLLRHYHAPTVEDVLREFADEVYADADNEIRDRDFLCAKYAKRLTLAEGEDA